MSPNNKQGNKKMNMLHMPVVNEIPEGIRMLYGKIHRIDHSGIWVELSPSGRKIECDVLQTCSCRSLELSPGFKVLCTIDDCGNRGCILGVVHKPMDSLDETKTIENATRLEEHLQSLKLNIDDRLEVRCGDSTLIMNEDGRLILKGRNITSHARELIKLLAAGGVDIN